MSEVKNYWKMAAEKLPGPDYYWVLEQIHLALRPQYYLEIGIAKGASLAFALEDTYAVGVDPEILVIFPLRAWTKIYQNTSDEFFDKYYGDLFDLIFLDGLHEYDAVVKDFCQVEALCKPTSAILIHDTIPLFPETAGKESTEMENQTFWTGDVWKLVPALIKGRPDLKIFTIACPPSGLTVIHGFSDEPKGLSSEIVEEFKSKDFDWINPQWQTIQNAVSNDLNVWQPLLKNRKNIK